MTHVRTMGDPLLTWYCPRPGIWATGVTTVIFTNRDIMPVPEKEVQVKLSWMFLF